jgi:hypothetical protein
MSYKFTVKKTLMSPYKSTKSGKLGLCWGIIGTFNTVLTEFLLLLGKSPFRISLMLVGRKKPTH